MKKIIFLTVYLFILTTFSQINAFACSCPGDPDTPLKEKVQWSLKNTYALFTGEVMEIIKKSEGNKYSDYSVKLRVEQSWKGKLPQEIIIDTEPDLGAFCGYDFIVGKEYLIYTYGSNINGLRTKGCEEYANREVEKLGDVLKILGKGKKIGKRKSSSL